MDKELLESIIRTAFNKGQDWAETYKGWFTPTAEQTEEQIQEVIDLYK